MESESSLHPLRGADLSLQVAMKPLCSLLLGWLPFVYILVIVVHFQLNGWNAKGFSSLHGPPEELFETAINSIVGPFSSFLSQPFSLPPFLCYLLSTLKWPIKCLSESFHTLWDDVLIFHKPFFFFFKGLVYWLEHLWKCPLAILECLGSSLGPVPACC